MYNYCAKNAIIKPVLYLLLDLYCVASPSSSQQRSSKHQLLVKGTANFLDFSRQT